jgi:hypothetical protein
MQQKCAYLLPRKMPYLKHRSQAIYYNQNSARGVIIICAIALFLEFNFPIKMWPEVGIYAAYLLNRTLTQTLGRKTPMQALYKYLKLSEPKCAL